jgi:hypothetical protein
MAGFGDLESLAKPWFVHIDIAMMDGTISLIVQVFFCYRIWTLNKRLWWLCLVIAVVRMILPTFSKLSSFPYKSYLLPKRLRHSGMDSMWALCKLCCDLASNARLRKRPASSLSQLYTYAFLALLDALIGLQVTALAMV